MDIKKQSHACYLLQDTSKHVINHVVHLHGISSLESLYNMFSALLIIFISADCKYLASNLPHCIAWSFEDNTMGDAVVHMHISYILYACVVTTSRLVHQPNKQPCIQHFLSPSPAVSPIRLHILLKMAFKARLRFRHSGLFSHAPAHLSRNCRSNQVLPSDQMLLCFQSSPRHCLFNVQTWGSVEAQEWHSAYTCACKCSELWSPAHAALSSRLQHSGWAVFSLAEVVRNLVGMHHSLTRAANTEAASGFCSIGLTVVLIRHGTWMPVLKLLQNLTCILRLMSLLGRTS